jgi:serine/threonine protein phosphatase PrpC
VGGVAVLTHHAIRAFTTAAANHTTLSAARQTGGDTVGSLEGIRASSKTALSLVVADDNAVWTATLGDTAVVRARGRRTRMLSSSHAFLGPQTPLPHVVTAKLREGDRILAASDGVVDYLGPKWRDLLAQASRTADGEALAQRILELALDGGAGDNVAVAVIARGRERRGAFSR